MKLTGIEIRVIGALIEKELTTPDYYPLTLNGLRNACNQKSNRNPVMSIDEELLMSTLDELRDKKMVIFSSGQGQRSLKYKHNVEESLSIDQREVALLAALFLRGAQTLGELRQRTQRMHQFSSLDEVQQFLTALANRENPLVKLLPRKPGQKEQRYVHLLNDLEDINDEEPEIKEERPENEIALLKEKIEQLQEEMIELKLDYYNLKKELGIT